MKNLLKLKVLLLAFTMIFTSISVAADRILPEPKPTITKEAKIKAAKKKAIYPQKKPQTKTEKKQTDNNLEISEELKDQEKAFIYPEKKPLVVVKKVDKAAVKSEILSKKDFKIAKAAFKAIKDNKWQTALKLSQKSKDKSVFKLINYLYPIDDLSEKMQRLALDDVERKRIAEKGWTKYHKYFNSKIIAEYILKKTFNVSDKKYLWEK